MIKSKQRIYYIVETEDKFICSITNEIFENTRILEICDRSVDKVFVKIKGSKDPVIYEAKATLLSQITTIVHSFNVHLN